jgi:putative transposase
MPGTFTQIYIQVIFAVKGLESLISLSWEDHLYKYISGLIRNKEQKLLAINGMPDHIHFLIGMRPSCTLSDLVREIKKSSNEFTKEKKLHNTSFNGRKDTEPFHIVTLS